MRRLQCPHLSFYAQQTRKRRNPASSLKKTELVVQGLRLTRRRVEHSTICREPAMRQETLRHLLPWQCKKNLQPFPRRAPQLRPRIGPGNALELSAREPSAQHRRRAVWTSSVRPGAFLREAARSSRQRPSSALLRKTLRHRYPICASSGGATQPGKAMTRRERAGRISKPRSSLPQRGELALAENSHCIPAGSHVRERLLERSTVAGAAAVCSWG